MSIAVVDYEAGNLRSVETALHRINIPFTVTSDPEVIRRSERIIFPGVGHAGHAMQHLRASGIGQALREAHAAAVPIFGICLGCQIVLSDSEESPDDACLDLIPGSAVLFPASLGLKVPHMGWNAVQHDETHWLFDGIPSGVAFYFVHSYYPELRDPQEHGIAVCDYGVQFACAMERGSLVATQFHPEKSGEFGIRMLENFCTRTRG
ncbi:imidazole glycerol phosphate synthase subunit HisH [Spirochaeta africana]|uniref:Imidazole glycerol phosphate synthase subunit HisH n=1 Tax=Spirochaeta africana (strain ATCC 700263 / DSM 8902 / Z-7692) TaxID=889378 RepID=H9ULW3_SPIAZ|nr:imidazole glycerol phosphate synthase subunit HisH [Spirochaeta africana]AFG38506.1 imidazole glycerol phosphate synthase, glutamine amidotransferase subunit [Spirochaeta africana DSM 8902]